jgi:formate dehydrogenase iron-sulfur subunit
MALKDLLVYVDQTDAAHSRLRLAADLAYRHESRLTALFTKECSQKQVEMRKDAELALISGEDFDRLKHRIRNQCGTVYGAPFKFQVVLATQRFDRRSQAVGGGVDRQRGGAGFPTGIKWKTVADTAADRKYIVCNADEGDSCTFADRMIMEGDPFVLIEGMTIAGIAVGATYGYIYVRSEYPHAIAVLNDAIRAARRGGMLGRSIAGSPLAFDIEVRVGAGAYVCGEETSLLDSLEGKRAVVRAKPPLPAHKGLFGKPTVINNVLSLASIPIILEKRGTFYRDSGMGRSRGTMPIQLADNIKYPGLYETAFGVTLGELVEEIGGGTATGRPVRAVQVGGPLGAYFPRSMFDLPFDYEAFAEAEGLIGHGGVVVFDDSVDMAKQARFAMEFCSIESCGKCTPCRVGSTRGVEVIDRIIRDENRAANMALLEDLCHTLKFGSLCALGGFTPYPVMSALTHFPEDFGAPRRLAAAE